MDLIYMNSEKEDIGVLKDFTFDLAFGSDENDFECTVNSNNNVCEAGYYLYYEGNEYGGVIDSVEVDTEAETVIYKGRTWHGIIASKILQPDVGSDYLTVSGEANAVLSYLVSRMGIGSLFTVQTESSGINISSYKMNRYIDGYSGILKMLKANGAKLNVVFKNGFVELSAKPFVNYAEDEQFDTDKISFTIQKNYKHINHVICMGKGDLKDRRIIHVYSDALGNISGTQTLTGLDEVCATYDNSNAESDDELKQGGIDMITESFGSDSVDFNFESDDERFDVNDVIGAKEFITNTVVAAYITKKIVNISNNTTSISYECGSGSGDVSSGSYPSSGSGVSNLIDSLEAIKSNTQPNQYAGALAVKALDDSLANKQDKTDNTLSTTSKTIVGAVNEVNESLTKGLAKVNGIGTLYSGSTITTSVKATTVTKIVSITLPKGRYILTAFLGFTTSTSEVYNMYLLDANGTAFTYVRGNNSGGGGSIITYPLVTSAQTVVYLATYVPTAKTTSGAKMIAMKISDY